MKKQVFFNLITALLLCLTFNSISGSIPENDPATQDSTSVSENDKLVVVWTSGDKEVAMKMVFMYTFNAKKYEWWDDITLLVWGPSSKLLSEDKDLQDYLKKIIDSGVEVLACKGCADQYEVTDKLEEIGVIVRYTGVDLTNFIRERHVITF